MRLVSQNRSGDHVKALIPVDVVPLTATMATAWYAIPPFPCQHTPFRALIILTATIFFFFKVPALPDFSIFPNLTSILQKSFEITCVFDRS